MDLSKENIETELARLLDELLARGNQDGSIINLEYDKGTETCKVTMSVHIVEEDQYIGFQAY